MQRKDMLSLMGALVVLTVAVLPLTAQPPQSAPKLEHFAFASALDYLDGPRLEAMDPRGYRLCATDPDGNVFFTRQHSTSWIRCVRMDGQIETIAGDDHWSSHLNSGLSEGPAAYFPNMGLPPQAGVVCKPGVALTVSGQPLRGEEQGCIYVFWPGKSPYKVFKNQAQKGRWWFQRVGTPGKATPPVKIGQSASVANTDLTGARIGPGWIEWQGNMYDFDHKAGKITCILTLNDYQDKVEAALGQWHGKQEKRRIGAPEFLQRAEDGSFYLLYYWKTYAWGGQVFKVSADRSKCEHIVSHRNDPGLRQNLDGPGLETTWHCGPAFIQTVGNNLFLSAIDSNVVRRWQDGRVATLFQDGEWRENPTPTKARAIVCNGYWPAQFGRPYIYIFDPGENHAGDCRAYLFGPVDFRKASQSTNGLKK